MASSSSRQTAEDTFCHGWFYIISRRTVTGLLVWGAHRKESTAEPKRVYCCGARRLKCRNEEWLERRAEPANTPINQTVQPTGASRLAQGQVERRRRLEIFTVPRLAFTLNTMPNLPFNPSRLSHPIDL